MQQSFIAVNTKGNIPEVLVYGLIGSDEANSTEFVKAIKSLEAKHAKINVRINSDGGSIFQGLAMYNGILNSTAEIDVYIDGVAASMAAVLAMAGNKVYMSKYARMMTHSGSGALNGNATQLRHAAKLLDSLDHSMSVIYAQRTGKTPEQCQIDYVSKKEDKWFTAEQALAEKLIDGIYDAEAINLPSTIKAANEVWAFFNEHQFAAVFQSAQKQNENMELKLSAASRVALNIGDNADASAIDTAITALKAKADQADVYKAAKETAEQKLADNEKAVKQGKVATLIATAKKEKGLTEAAATQFAADYKENPEGLEAILKTLPVHKTITSQLKPEAGEETEETMAAEWDKLDKSKGGTAKLKAENPERFKALFKAKYGKEPNE